MSSIANVSIIGAGSWGTTIANLLSSLNNSVTLYHYNHGFIDQLEKTRKHPHLKDVNISKDIKLTSNIDHIHDANFIFIAVPTNSIRDALNQVSLSQDTPVISLSKGIERNTHNYPSEIILNSTNLLKSSICSLSGPSHAEEVSSRIPTAVVIAGTNVTLNKKVQELMSCSTFRVYSNTDLKGVEIAGALKNVISIASGICIGLQFGDNTIAALITRGLNEIVRLGNIYDADMSTFYGLAGIGDLSVTAFSQYSRNRKFGIDIGRGVSPEESIESMGMVVEGYYTIDALHEIIVANNLEMPISNSIYEILYNNLSPKQAIMELMNRTLTHENN